jgi:Ribbon-helix-helix protein, copG family
MVRTTVYLPASVIGGVRTIARQRGLSSAAIIRSAVDDAVGGYRPPPRGGFL